MDTLQESKPRYPRRPGFTGAEDKSNSATSEAAKSPANTPRERKLTELKAPELFQFKHPGDMVDGILLRIDPISIKDKSTFQQKRVTQYTVRRDTGEVVKMLGTYDIDSKLMPSHVGHFIEVVYTCDNKEIKRGDNYMKMFRVSVEEKSSVAASNKFNDGTEITDEDIPF